MQDKSPQRLYSLRAAASFLGVSLPTLRLWIRDGLIATVRAGPAGKQRVDVLAMEDFILRNTRRAEVSFREQKKLMKEREVAKTYGLSLAQLRRWRKGGGGPQVTFVGRSVLYFARDIEIYLEACKHSIEPDAPSSDAAGKRDHDE